MHENILLAQYLQRYSSRPKSDALPLNIGFMPSNFGVSRVRTTKYEVTNDYCENNKYFEKIR